MIQTVTHNIVTNVQKVKKELASLVFEVDAGVWVEVAVGKAALVVVLTPFTDKSA